MQTQDHVTAEALSEQALAEWNATLAEHKAPARGPRKRKLRRWPRCDAADWTNGTDPDDPASGVDDQIMRENFLPDRAPNEPQASSKPIAPQADVAQDPTPLQMALLYRGKKTAVQVKNLPGPGLPPGLLLFAPDGQQAVPLTQGDASFQANAPVA
jgi:hypothetical protein